MWEITIHHTTIKITSEFRNVSDAARDAHGMSHLFVEACTQRLAAGRGDGYPIAAATAAVIARLERLSAGGQVWWQSR